MEFTGIRIPNLYSLISAFISIQNFKVANYNKEETDIADGGNNNLI